jgi:3-dehydroquinate synthase
MAEAIKHGVIRDAAYFASLADAAACLDKDLGRLEDVVRRSIAIKAEVVSADEQEHGVRAILNFGHTVGHAVEALSGFDLLHGEAVAVGMRVEAHIAELSGIAAPGLADQLAGQLERYALPLALPDSLSTDRLCNAMQSDKKARLGQVRFALPRAPGIMAQSGDGAWTVEVDSGVIRQALDTCR